jgi:hypothetical protein
LGHDLCRSTHERSFIRFYATAGQSGSGGLEFDFDFDFDSCYLGRSQMSNAGADVDYSTHQLKAGATVSGNAIASALISSIQQSAPYVGSGPGRCVIADVRYNIILMGSDGFVKWADTFCGTVVIAGLNKLLDATFKTGLASPAWYVGLLDGATAPVIGVTDTMASHAGWIENVGVSNATRPALTPGTILNGAVDNSAARAIFNINASGEIAGAFITTGSALSGSTGTLYDVGLFLDSARDVANGDTLQVSVALSISAA